MKHNNIHIIGVPEKEKEQGTIIYFEEIITEYFSNFMKEKDIQVREMQSTKQHEPKEAHTKIHHN